MAAIRYRDFRGLVPKKSSKLLPQQAAVTAQNTKIESGELRAWFNLIDEYEPTKTGELLTIYLYDPEDTAVWLHWASNIDVAKSPIKGDTTIRSYMTGSALDAPRAFDNTMADSDEPTSGSITGATQANPVVITDGAHGLQTGAEVTITGVSGMTEINDRTFIITKIDANTFSLDGEDGTGHTAYTSGGTWTRTLGEFPEQTYLLGVPAPTTAPSVAVTGTPAGNPLDRAYVYTFVTEKGEEGPPSPVSSVLEVEDDETVNITSMDAAPSGDYMISAWRIYRTLGGQTSSDYQFVAEVTINTSSPQYNDAIADAALGEAITSTEWDPPPADLHSIRALPNGVLVGASGNQVCFSEPWAPHAWPVAYRKACDFDVVALGNFGTNVVVGTKGTTYLITGLTPSVTSMVSVLADQPCVSNRSMASTISNVVYASPDGLVSVGHGGAKVITSHLLSRNNWQELLPDTMHTVIHDNKIFIWRDDGLVNGVRQGHGLVFEEIDGRLEYTTLGFYATAAYVDPLTDALYVCVYEGNGLYIVRKWEGGGTRMAFNWKSSETLMPNPVNMAVAKVVGQYTAELSAAEQAALDAERAAIIALNDAILADLTLIEGDLWSTELMDELVPLGGTNLYAVPAAYAEPEKVTFELFADGESKFTKQIGNSRIFRLPGGYLADYYAVRVSGKVNVEEIQLATTATEIKQI